MATYSIKRAKHATLAPSTVDTVTLTGPVSHLEVLNRSLTDPIYMRLDGVAPVVGADDNIIIPISTVWDRKMSAHAPHSVKLISAGAADYSVQGVNE